MKFYTAGPFTPYKDYKDWRDYLKEVVKNHEFIDPRDNNQTSPMFFVREDLEGVKKSDGIILYRPPLVDNLGAAWEHGIACGISIASEKKIPTIYIDETKFIYPILSASSKRTFTDLEAAALYLNFLESWENEFEAIYKFLKWEKEYYLKLKNK